MANKYLLFQQVSPLQIMTGQSQIQFQENTVPFGDHRSGQSRMKSEEHHVHLMRLDDIGKTSHSLPLKMVIFP